MNDSKDHKAAAEPPLDCRVGRTDSERLHWLMEWMALNGLLIYHEWATIGNEHGPCWVLRRPAMVAGDSVEGHDPRTAMGAIDSAMSAPNELSSPAAEGSPSGARG